MKLALRAAFLAIFALVLVVEPVSMLAIQEQASLTRTALTPEQMEDFLLNGRIVQMKTLGKGITNSRRATLSNQLITHDVHIQTVDESKLEFKGTRGTELNFKDSYRFNVAGYRLARLLGLDHVPMSVERRVEGRPAAVTWWVDDVLMEEGERHKTQAMGPDRSRTAAQIHIMRVFDELIHNTDRNAGNLLWTTDWKMWMIDHTRAFRISNRLRNPKLLERCERSLLDRMRALTSEMLARELGGSVNKTEIQALLERRDQIVKLFDDRIAQRGEEAVLYTQSR
jgi:hypothetical protein